MAEQELTTYAVPKFIDDLGRAKNIVEGLLRHVEKLERELDLERRRNNALLYAMNQKQENSQCLSH